MPKAGNRKPKAIREAEGNRGHRPIPDEPTYRVGAIMPRGLTSGAKSVWRRLYPLLTKARVLAETDRDVFTAYCTTYDRWWKAEKEVQAHQEKNGTQLVQRANGDLAPHPSIRIVHLYLEKLRQLQADLGLTPTARSHVNMLEDSSKAEDELSEFLRGGNRTEATEDANPN